MTVANIVQNVACDIALLERTARLKPPTSTSSNSSAILSDDTQSVCLRNKLGFIKPGVQNQVPWTSKVTTREVKHGIQPKQSQQQQQKPRASSHFLEGAKPPNYSNSWIKFRGVQSGTNAGLRLLTSAKSQLPAAESKQTKQTDRMDISQGQRYQKFHRRKSTDLESGMSNVKSHRYPESLKNSPMLGPRLSSIPLPLPLQPLSGKITHMYVTTESSEAGTAIIKTVKALYPNLKIISSVDDISVVTFTHSTHSRGKENRLKPVSVAHHTRSVQIPFSLVRCPRFLCCFFLSILEWPSGS